MKKKLIDRFSDEEFLSMASQCRSISSLTKLLGYKARNQNICQQIKDRLSYLNFDSSEYINWVGGKKYLLEDLKEAVSKSESFAGVIRILGAVQGGGSQRYLTAMIRKSGIDFSHFTGQRHGKGGKATRRTPNNVFVKRSAEEKRCASQLLRRMLLEVGVEHCCEICKTGNEWHGKTLVLQVDHIDGDSRNDVFSNLRFICPNCHSQQTETNKSWRNTIK